MKSKKLTVLSIVLIVFLIAAISMVLIQKKGLLSQSSHVPVAESVGFDKVMTLDGHGFQPPREFIGLGQKLAFRNMTSSKITIYSDPHPTHSDNTALNKIELSVGELVIIKPKNSGTYSFHVEELSSVSAIIEIQSTSIAPIVKSNAGQQEILNPLTSLIDPNDPNSVEFVFKKLLADPETKNSCHAIGHDIGHRMYELFGLTNALSVRFNDPLLRVEELCSGGYIHGVLEEAAVHDPALIDNPDLMCGRFAGKYRSSCYHGLGHAIMFHNERDLDLALAECRKIVNDLDRWAAYEGVWMELFWGDIEYFGKDKLGWNKENPFATCKKYAKGEELSSCYLYSLYGYLKFHPKDYAGAIKLSNSKALSASETNLALKGIGLFMVGVYQGESYWKAEGLLTGLSLEAKKSLYGGMVGYSKFAGISKAHLSEMVSQFTVDKEVFAKALQKY